MIRMKLTNTMTQKQHTRKTKKNHHGYMNRSTIGRNTIIVSATVSLIALIVIFIYFASIGVSKFRTLQVTRRSNGWWKGGEEWFVKQEIIPTFNISYGKKYRNNTYPIHEGENAIVSIVVLSLGNSQQLSSFLDSVFVQDKICPFETGLMYDIQVVVVFDQARWQKNPFEFEALLKRIRNKKSKNRVIVSFTFKDPGGVPDSQNVGIARASGIWVMVMNEADRLLLDFSSYLSKDIQDRHGSEVCLHQLDTVDFVVHGQKVNKSLYNKKKSELDILQENIIPSSALIHKRVYLHSDIDGAFSQWWKDPYIFFEWHNWHFWINHKLFIQNCMYIDRTLLQVANGSNFCAGAEFECRAMLRLANFRHYPRQVIEDDVVDLIHSKEFERISGHPSWHNAMHRYGDFFSNTIVWRLLAAIQGENKEDIMNFLTKSETIDELLGFLRILYSACGRLQNPTCPTEMMPVLRRDFEYDELDSATQLLVVSVRTGIAGMYQEYEKEITEILKASRFERIAVLKENKHDATEVSGTLIHILQAEEQDRTADFQVKGYEELFRLLEAEAFVMLSASHLILNRDSVANRGWECVKHYEIRVVAKDLRASSVRHLRYGWRQGILYNKLMTTADNRDVVAESLFSKGSCYDIFFNTINTDICQATLVLFNPLQFSKTFVLSSFSKLIANIPNPTLIFKSIQRDNDPVFLRTYREALTSFVEEGCLNSEAIQLISSLKPTQNTLVWWLANAMFQQNCSNIDNPAKMKEDFEETMSVNPYDVVEKCTDFFLRQRPRGLYFHQIISRLAHGTRLNMSILSAASILHNHKEGKLIVHSSVPGIQEKYEEYILTSDRIVFLPICDGVLPSLESSPSTRFFQKYYSAGPYYYSHRTDLYRYLILKYMGGLYADSDFIFFKDTTHLMNVVGRESDEWVNGAVMKFERSHQFLKILLDAFSTSYDENIWGCVGPNLITSKSKEFPHMVNVLPVSAFYPFHWTEVKEYASTSLTAAEYVRLQKGSYGMHAWGRMILDLNSTEGIIPRSFLGRSLGCSWLRASLSVCPIAF